jgi:hypothetical protein
MLTAEAAGLHPFSMSQFNSLNINFREVYMGEVVESLVPYSTKGNCVEGVFKKITVSFRYMKKICRYRYRSRQKTATSNVQVRF